MAVVIILNVYQHAISLMNKKRLKCSLVFQTLFSVDTKQNMKKVSKTVEKYSWWLSPAQ